MVLSNVGRSKSVELSVRFECDLVQVQRGSAAEIKKNLNMK